MFIFIIRIRVLLYYTSGKNISNYLKENNKGVNNKILIFSTEQILLIF